MSDHCVLLNTATAEALVSVGGVEFTLPQKHTDDRRTIYEKWVEGIGLLQVLLISSSNESGPLGLHYHRYTQELFNIARGGGEVLLVSVNPEGGKSDDVELHEVKSGDLVKVMPKTAHTFYLEPASVMTCIASHKYDQDDVVSASWLVKT